MQAKIILSAAGIAAALLLALPAASEAAEEAKRLQPVVTKESVAMRIENVGRLVSVSSGSKRITVSDSEEAKSMRDEASGQWRNAKVAFDKGDYKESDRLLGEATRTMFSAVRLLGSPQESTDKSRKDLVARMASTDALLTALKRISAQKKLNGKTKAKIEEIERGLAEARRLAANDDLAEGRKVADEAYEVAKLSVEALREGETVVRSLEFENDKDEYHYELDRNDTHRMLVKILLAEKRKSAMVDAMVEKFIVRAEELRQEAESQAEAGDTEAAIETLERSTKELVRAIRGAGVYIPG